MLAACAQVELLLVACKAQDSHLQVISSNLPQRLPSISVASASEEKLQSAPALKQPSAVNKDAKQPGQFLKTDYGMISTMHPTLASRTLLVSMHLQLECKESRRLDAPALACSACHTCPARSHPASTVDILNPITLPNRACCTAGDQAHARARMPKDAPRWYLMDSELQSLSSYMRGRLTLDKVKAQRAACSFKKFALPYACLQCAHVQAQSCLERRGCEPGERKCMPHYSNPRPCGIDSAGMTSYGALL